MWAFTSHICEFQRLYIGRNNRHHLILLLADPIWFKAWSVYYQFTCWGCHILDLMQSGAISFTSTWCASSHNSAIGVLQATIRQSTKSTLSLCRLQSTHLFWNFWQDFRCLSCGRNLFFIPCSHFITFLFKQFINRKCMIFNHRISTCCPWRDWLGVYSISSINTALLLFLQNVS